MSGFQILDRMNTTSQMVEKAQTYEMTVMTVGYATLIAAWLKYGSIFGEGWTIGVGSLIVISVVSYIAFHILMSVARQKGFFAYADIPYGLTDEEFTKCAMAAKEMARAATMRVRRLWVWFFTTSVVTGFGAAGAMMIAAASKTKAYSIVWGAISPIIPNGWVEVAAAMGMVLTAIVAYHTRKQWVPVSDVSAYFEIDEIHGIWLVLRNTGKKKASDIKVTIGGSYDQEKIPFTHVRHLAANSEVRSMICYSNAWKDICSPDETLEVRTVWDGNKQTVTHFNLNGYGYCLQTGKATMFACVRDIALDIKAIKGKIIK